MKSIDDAVDVAFGEGPAARGGPIARSGNSALPCPDGLHRECERQDLFTPHRIGQGTNATAVRWLQQDIA